ncbi:MAG: squalene/phytoene synthase family protein, partial [Magnetococcus sp. WYHC-3]
LAPPVALAKLQWWRSEVVDGFAGSPNHPIMRELVWARDRFGLPEEPFFRILDGMFMDLSGAEMATMADLLAYCDRVAVAVGELAFLVFADGRAEGALRQRGMDFAHHLGIALQLTNILRDLAEDAQRGRLYLPREELGFHLTARELVRHVGDARLEAALTTMAGLAEAHFAQARALGRQAPMGPFLPGLVMAQLYGGILQRMRRRGWPVASAMPLGRRCRVWLTLRGLAIEWWHDLRVGSA